MIFIIRKYGTAPFKAAVVHGGPGACGSVASVAHELSRTFGVVEPIQTKHTIPGLVAELYEQILSVSRKPVTLIGHSWGAWLIVLFAKEYPEMANRLVLVGCGPFKEKYLDIIMKRRLSNLSKEEGELFIKTLQRLNNNNNTAPDKDSALGTLGRLADKADNYEAVEDETQDNIQNDFEADGEMYTSIWPQAAEMRKNDELYCTLKEIKCPVTVIQGEYDSHPVEGVIEPLQEQGVDFDVHLLPKCGHSPFNEKFARETFYEILRSIVNAFSKAV